MDDLCPLNHRKRKAESDDCNVPPQQAPVPPQDPLMTDPASPSSSSSNAPRQTWPVATANTLWATERSRGSTPKRPRLAIEVPSRLPGRKISRRSPTKPSPSRSPTLRAGSDLEDIGIAPTSDPGPSSGSLLHRASTSLPFDLNPVPTPPLLPLINRQTLKELDLDAILRNPQLRHDLLFDPGLQFRPTSSRRKRDLSEKYWAAVVQEIENGCTCVSFDSRGKSHLPVCVCPPHASDSPSSPTLHHVRSNVFTSRMPSRIQPLLSEFLEVLLLVIQPLCTISGVYVNPGTFKSQMQEHSEQASYIRSLFDTFLIEQELKNNVFDPSGLFRTIGVTLKGHCAPMRDRSVEAMVQAAESCGADPSSSRSKDAIKAIRMCMEILELMKLDIANHQLQTLRPFLIRTCGQFELRTLKSRHGPDALLSTTREWIEAAHTSMMHKTLLHPHVSAQSLQYSSLSGNQQLYICIIRGLVDLVFNPPLTSSVSLSTPTNTPPTSPTAPSVSTPLPAFPETLILDNHRMLLLSSDAADATALNMLLLLYRQLALSENSNSGSPLPPKTLTDADMIRMKSEIRDISGSFRLGACFSRNQQKTGNKDAERWRVVKEDLVLQISRRARTSRGTSAGTAKAPTSSTSALSSSPTPPPSSSSSVSTASSSSSPSTASTSPPTTPTRSLPSSPISESSLPNPRTVALGQKWVDSHMQSESALSAMLHNRLRDAVFNAVLTSTYPGRDLTNGCRAVPSLDFSINAGTSGAGVPVGSPGTLSGLEPLSDEIRTLVEKISLLALIHLNAYLPLYEKEGFRPSSSS
ncbi:T-complex protein 11-domain-containing protein [Ephemerocybe angulata]|uniref:T-complex protein 11-domain-containing protein n=1 Tax=Ephemerocybe angulata TaxID=980116 RepID=A0A8H6I2B9_9AGAR|nr:T-complex protein 11-domain-containing protein [Tulosesus angulatus]